MSTREAQRDVQTKVGMAAKNGGSPPSLIFFRWRLNRGVDQRVPPDGTWPPFLLRHVLALVVHLLQCHRQYSAVELPC